MGQEISQSHFDETAFQRFQQRLISETTLLGQLFQKNALADSPLVAGLEIEAWLVDKQMRPSPINERYLASVNEPLASAELAKFNIELNTHPLPLSNTIFSELHKQLQVTWQNAASHAEKLHSHLLMIGILPTLVPSDLTVKNMSDLNRYRALNNRILETRTKPIHLDITGEDHLDLDHDDIMLESATTSLQLHTKVPASVAHHFYNASIISSAAMVAICGNAPFLFGKNLWHESRVPLFEQAVDIGGFDGAAHGPVKRVSFGTGYARHSIFECFEENLHHFPILLPEQLDDSDETFSHLRLHNGTIWRWNRPLIGFDVDGKPHIRIEHRTPAAGPTLIDTVANAAFYYGLTKQICDELTTSEPFISFSDARDNFYRAARYGLNSQIIWQNGNHLRLNKLILTELLERAEDGLDSLGIIARETRTFLDIIRHRVDSEQTGSAWQRQFMQHSKDFAILTERYLSNQSSDKPVSQWDLL